MDFQKQNSITSPLPPSTLRYVEQDPKVPQPHKILKLIVIISVVLVFLGGSFSLYTRYNNKETIQAKPVLTALELWTQFLSSDGQKPSRTSFAISYNDRMGKKIGTEQTGQVVQEWSFGFRGDSITDSQNAQNFSANILYELSSGDIGAHLDTHFRKIGGDIYFQTAKNPFIQLGLAEIDPVGHSWVKLTPQNQSDALNFSESDLKELQTAWSAKKILTPTGIVEQDKSATTTQIALTLNQEGIDAAIDKTLTLFTVQQLKAGKSVSNEQKMQIALGLKTLAHKVSVKNLDIWIDGQNNLIRVRGSLVIPSILQTIEKLDRQSQTVIVSFGSILLNSPLPNTLATRLLPKGQVLGDSTDSDSGGVVNPLNDIVFDALLNFDTSYYGFGEIQKVDIPTDVFDLSPFLENLQDNLENKSINI